MEHYLRIRYLRLKSNEVSFTLCLTNEKEKKRNNSLLLLYWYKIKVTLLYTVHRDCDCNIYKRTNDIRRDEETRVNYNTPTRHIA